MDRETDTGPPGNQVAIRTCGGMVDAGQSMPRPEIDTGNAGSNPAMSKRLGRSQMNCGFFSSFAERLSNKTEHFFLGVIDG